MRRGVSVKTQQTTTRCSQTRTHKASWRETFLRLSLTTVARVDTCCVGHLLLDVVVLLVGRT